MAEVSTAQRHRRPLPNENRAISAFALCCALPVSARVWCTYRARNGQRRMFAYKPQLHVQLSAARPTSTAKRDRHLVMGHEPSHLREYSILWGLLGTRQSAIEPAIESGSLAVVKHAASLMACNARGTRMSLRN